MSEPEEVVEPVETVDPGISKEEHESIRQKALEEFKTAKHNWKMKGGWLTCDSCPFPHGSYIGTHKIMVGIDDNGFPILKNRL